MVEGKMLVVVVAVVVDGSVGVNSAVVDIEDQQQRRCLQRQ
jgi:hypothetical protein